MLHKDKEQAFSSHEELKKKTKLKPATDCELQSPVYSKAYGKHK